MQKLQLHQKLQQSTNPLQILQIKILGYNTMELEEKILQEIEENPALEEGPDLLESDIDSSNEFEEDSYSDEDISLGDYLTEDDIPSYRLNQAQDKEEKTEQIVLIGESESFNEALIRQLHLRELSEIEQKVGEYIIGNLDSDGYLRRDLNSISDDLLFHAEIDFPVKKLKQLVAIIQDFDPAGVCAKDLRECLYLQLMRKAETKSIIRAKKILKDMFDAFTKKHFDRIMIDLRINEDELKEAIHEITLLNPKPGNSANEESGAEIYHVIPDFLVETLDEEITISLNSKNIPDLHVSKTYQNMLEDYTANKANRTKSSKGAIQFVKQKLDNAKWFIEALKERQRTLLSTMEAIVHLQRNFFLTGDEVELRPMNLKDISEVNGLDISTVSRVINSKYVQTNWGIFSLKYFFADGVQNESGEEVSTQQIKAILTDAMATENKKKPLTDEKLCDILNEKGFLIARRTVAKYREALGFPVARLRKEI